MNHDQFELLISVLKRIASGIEDISIPSVFTDKIEEEINKIVIVLEECIYPSLRELEAVKQTLEYINANIQAMDKV